jgi:hypothetical protein
VQIGAALGLNVYDMQSGTRERDILHDCPVYTAVMHTLNEQNEDEDGYFEELPNWNDADERTEQEVLDLLHATAKRVLGIPPDAS